MRNVFPGYFRPTKDEFDDHWNNSTFIFDANVLLNLYRYSDATRQELQNAITALNGRVYVSHQAALEFLRNRLTVTSDQSKEYTTATKDLRELVKKIASKDKHPFIDEAKLLELNKFSDEICENLDKHQRLLLDKLSNDIILEFVEGLFKDKTGKPYEVEKLDEISKLGAERYAAKIPPGYKDINKESSDDPFRKYGDLIVWLQTIDYSKENECSVIFITDDKKEDWWLEQSGRTISPRPELIEEFKNKTGKNIWMYTVGRFVEESAAKNKKEVNPDVIDEIRKISEQLERMTKESRDMLRLIKNDSIASIHVSQEPEFCNEYENSGVMIVTLSHDMRYATGSGKFIPELIQIPTFEVEFINGPADLIESPRISFGCGTTKDFNVHLKAIRKELPAGDYVFKYVANIDDMPQEQNV